MWAGGCRESVHRGTRLSPQIPSHPGAAAETKTDGAAAEWNSGPIKHLESPTVLPALQPLVPTESPGGPGQTSGLIQPQGSPDRTPGRGQVAQAG